MELRYVRIAAALLLLGSVATAVAQESEVRYISDETAITLRQDKGMEAPVVALLVSGTKVDLVETDTTAGYAHVKVGPGREGWVLARYLSMQPAARVRLPKVEAELAETKGVVARLEAENQQLRSAQGVAASTAAPATAELLPTGAGTIVEPSAPTDHAHAQAMFTGAGLFVVGLLIGLLIPLIPRGPRRSWSQL
jgi:SH3 domain protein